ncbi:MAG: hypothetical protein JNM79_14900 [Burkholderiales bacterium]|nr:hypothetical protein [Burkholderiales bacterium]
MESILAGEETRMFDLPMVGKSSVCPISRPGRKNPPRRLRIVQSLLDIPMMGSFNLIVFPL